VINDYKQHAEQSKEHKHAKTGPGHTLNDPIKTRSAFFTNFTLERLIIAQILAIAVLAVDSSAASDSPEGSSTLA
jgi:hypothetical protein